MVWCGLVVRLVLGCLLEVVGVCVLWCDSCLVR